jgi:NADH:ubiquinone oxidoreductase subunit 2 (subunit N)
VQNPGGYTLSILFGLAAVVCVVLAVLYYFGVIQFMVSDPHAHNHPTHAIVLLVAAVACLVAANFARPKPA